jgi:hypothetical protein
MEKNYKYQNNKNWSSDEELIPKMHWCERETGRF